MKAEEGNEIEEGYVGFNYMGNILFLKLHGGAKMLMKRRRDIKEEKRKGKQEIPLRLTGYWISMSRPVRSLKYQV